MSAAVSGLTTAVDWADMWRLLIGAVHHVGVGTDAATVDRVHNVR